MANTSTQARASFKDIAIVFSFVVNLILVLVVLALLVLLLPIKNQVVSPLLSNLDTAFAHLGEASIKDTININQQVPVNFTLPLQTETQVVLTKNVPLQALANFDLGERGRINGWVSLELPAGMALPVRLDLQVPVNQQITVAFAQPIDIKLGDKGLGPVVGELRGVVKPYIELLGVSPK